jgi:adenylosuccinate synthase
VRPTTAETYQQIYKVLDGWHEKLGAESLAGLHNRADKVREIEEFFGVEFTAGGGVTVRNKFEGCVGGNYKLPS